MAIGPQSVSAVSASNSGLGGPLPPGDYELTLEELAASLLVVGPDDKESYRTWDAAWRGRLVENLGVMVRQLWQVGGLGNLRRWVIRGRQGPAQRHRRIF